MTTPTPNSSTGELLQALADDLRSLMHQELRSAREELAATAKSAGRGAALLGGAGVLGALTAGTSAALLVRALDRVLPRPLSALVAVAIYGAAAGGLAAAGIAELRRALPLTPQDTLTDLRQDLDAATGAASTQREGSVSSGDSPA
jgi:Putative Actinobacterial Holin-X, holin superfamily III